jgi:hypothetical protein
MADSSWIPNNEDREIFCASAFQPCFHHPHYQRQQLFLGTNEASDDSRDPLLPQTMVEKYLLLG